MDDRRPESAVDVLEEGNEDSGEEDAEGAPWGTCPSV